VTQRLSRRRLVALISLIVEDARYPGQPVDSRIDDHTDLVDEPGLEEGSIE